MINPNDFAKLDGFRVYKVRSRGDKAGPRLYIAPVYVIGLPGDVDLLNKELAPLEWNKNEDKKVDAYVKTLTTPQVDVATFKFKHSDGNA